MLIFFLILLWGLVGFMDSEVVDSGAVDMSDFGPGDVGVTGFVFGGLVVIQVESNQF